MKPDYENSKLSPRIGSDTGDDTAFQEFKVKVEKNEEILDDIESFINQTSAVGYVKKEIFEIEYNQQNCERCGVWFFTDKSFWQHNLTHLEVKLDTLYECNYCRACYTEKNNLVKHIQTKHSTVQVKKTKRTYNCKECNRSYKYSYWMSHLRDVHGTSNLSCAHCPETFKCHTYLKKHMTKRHMTKKHMTKRHSNEETRDKREKIKCSLCPSILNGKSSLTLHMKNCHTEPAQCEICKSTLKSKTYLRAHMARVHYDDGKKHRCEICYKCYKSPRYLRVHQKNAHTKNKRKKNDPML